MASLSKVSVVIPTYNRAELLRSALQSVLAQTAQPREIVVVDDGSDHTPEVIRELPAGGMSITYMRGEHEQGPPTNPRSAARNQGFAATTAPWVAFLDSDDVWKPQRLERQLDALSASPQAGFAFCNVQHFGEHGLLSKEPALPRSADYNGYILPDVLEEPRAVSSTLMVRREAFERVGGFSLRPYNEDYELNVRLAARYRASYVAEPLLLMREHPGRSLYTYEEEAVLLLDYIEIVSSFTASHPRLPKRTRAAARRGIANVHYKLARIYLRNDNKPTARKHLRAALLLRPLDRRAISCYLMSIT